MVGRRDSKGMGWSKNIVGLFARLLVLGAARVNRSLERTASGENMTFSWTPSRLGAGKRRTQRLATQSGLIHAPSARMIHSISSFNEDALASITQPNARWIMKPAILKGFWFT